MIKAFITIALAFCYAPWVKTGIIKSQCGLKLYVYELTDKTAGQKQSSEVVSLKYQEINGQFPYMKNIVVMLKTLGTDSSAASFL